MGKTYLIPSDKEKELQEFLEKGATIVEESGLKEVTNNKNLAGSSFDTSKSVYLINE
jgi:hypothetical protein